MFIDSPEAKAVVVRFLVEAKCVNPTQPVGLQLARTGAGVRGIFRAIFCPFK